MMNPTLPEESARFAVKATAESHFSWLRTRMSLERTLMSWVRTSTALIGFGFTIVQFFERFKEMEHVKLAARPDMPRYLGLGLIAAGTFALAIAVWQYLDVVRYLRGTMFAPIAPEPSSYVKTPLFAVAIFLGLIGLFAFTSVLLRIV